MFAGTALSVRLLVCVGLSLFIINGPYVYVVVCIVYAYNLTKVLAVQFIVIICNPKLPHHILLSFCFVLFLYITPLLTKAWWHN